MQRRKKINSDKNIDSEKERIKKYIPVVLLIFISLSICGFIFILYLSKDLPSLEQLERYEPKMVSKIFSYDGELIREITGEENRIPVPFDKLPKHLINALIAYEDKNFYNHWGVNLYNFFGALWQNVKSMRYERGFSTISMQLARNMTYMTREKLLIRKIQEILTALKIEKTYTKNEILEMYFNQSDFGRMTFGIAVTANYHFSKKVEDLNLEECALLVALLQSPSAYSPFKNPELALKRRNIVLANMLKMNFITKQECLEAMNRPIVLKQGSRTHMGKAPYFTEYVRQFIDEKSNEIGLNQYEDGLSIYTTLNSKLQVIAENALYARIDTLQRQFRFRIARKYGDKNLNTTLQGAFVAIDPRNGHILAMVGGRNYNQSQFNRAEQAKRQPGSTFKPFVWTAAIDNGYTPNTELLDQEVVLYNYDGTIWRPQNYTKKRGGLTTLREGLRKSLNNISNRIILELLSPPGYDNRSKYNAGAKTVIKYAHNMGIKSELRAVNSISMGTSEVNLLEITSAFGVFPNKGIKIEPAAILKIVDRFGKVIYETKFAKNEAICEETAYIMTNMLQSGLEPGGTGYMTRSVYGFKRPAGGKTGTTQEFTDAWFIGFIPQLVAGTWIGYDDPQISLGERNSGAVIALPVWANFMKAACDSLQIPVEDFEITNGVIELEICKESKLIAAKYCPNVYKEIFNRKYAPTETCNVHNFISQKNSQ